MRRSAAKFASLIKEAAPITKLISEFLALRGLQETGPCSLVSLACLPCPSVPWFWGFPWLIFNKEFPWLFWHCLFLFQGICGFGRERKPLVNLRVFLDKTKKSRNGRTGFAKVRKVAERKFPEFFEFSSRILPRILLRISPNFSRIFRASFRGRRRPEKIHPKSPPFFNAKFPGKHEKNIHKILLESRQSNVFATKVISQSSAMDKRTTPHLFHFLPSMFLTIA